MTDSRAGDNAGDNRVGDNGAVLTHPVLGPALGGLGVAAMLLAGLYLLNGGLQLPDDLVFGVGAGLVFGVVQLVRRRRAVRRQVLDASSSSGA